MELKFFVLFLIISACKKTSLAKNANRLQELTNKKQEKECNKYFFSAYDTVLSNLVELQENEKALLGSIHDLKSKLAVTDGQLKFNQESINLKNDIILEKTEQLKNQEIVIKQKDDLIKSVTENINRQQNLLKSAEEEIKSKGELLKVKEKEVFDKTEELTLKDEENKTLMEQINAKDDKVNTLAAKINNLQSRLATAEEEIKTKNDLLKVKDKEIYVRTEELKGQDDQLKLKDIENKALNKKLNANADKVNNMTADIINLQSQLASVEEEIKTKEELIKVNNRDINEKNEKLKQKDDLIKTKDEIIEDIRKQIKSKGEEIDRKDIEIKDLREQISTKDIKIEGLNNQTISDLAKITKTTDELLMCSGTDRCLAGHPNGIYKINKPGIDIFNAPCNSTGWMVILRRQAPGTEDFNRNWKDYKDGFGDLGGEFFIGLEKLHQLTKDKTHELSVKLVDANRITAYAHYGEFKIGSEQESYALKSLGKYSGTARDSLNYHKGMKFTTFDRDNDNDNNDHSNCAKYYNGGWWYNQCFNCKLTGKYYKDGKSPYGNGIHWTGFRNSTTSLIFAEMMIRPKSL